MCTSPVISRHLPSSPLVSLFPPPLVSPRLLLSPLLFPLLAVEHYRSVYEPVNEDDLSWIKITNGGVNVQLNRIKGFLPGRITHFLMHLHTMPRSLYMSRHGQSEYNVLGKVGGNSGLSPNGQIYQKALAEWVEVRLSLHMLSSSYSVCERFSNVPR